jgi:hypothetical protein
VVAATLAAWQLTRLSSWLGARSLARLTPPPFATIDQPTPSARIGSFVVVKGRVAHETVRAPLWLVVSEGGRAWKPEGQIETAAGTWRRRVRLPGRVGMHYRLAVVAAEIPLHRQFNEQLARPPWRPPCWWLEEKGGCAGERRAWREADTGDGRTYPPLPEGAARIAFADLVVSHRDDVAEALNDD